MRTFDTSKGNNNNSIGSSGNSNARLMLRPALPRGRAMRVPFPMVACALCLSWQFKAVWKLNNDHGGAALPPMSPWERGGGISPSSSSSLSSSSLNESNYRHQRDGEEVAKKRVDDLEEIVTQSKFAKTKSNEPYLLDGQPSPHHKGNITGNQFDPEHDDEPAMFRGPPSSCEINRNLSDVLSTQIPIGWDDDAGTGGPGPSSWLEAMCPEVVDHYDQFPSFGEYVEFDSIVLPLQTTGYIAQAVCTIKVVQLLAASIDAHAYLWAGSHLGAFKHGQPIPWDDDVDMLLDFSKKEVLLDACARYGKHVLTGPVPVELRCVTAPNAIKVWLQYEGMRKTTTPSVDGINVDWYAPFVDLQLFVIQGDRIREVNPEGNINPYGLDAALADYFPTRPFYFGGVVVLGPPSRVSEDRYAWRDCTIPTWNHRLEQWAGVANPCVDCRDLSRVLPFVYDDAFIKVRGTTRAVFPVAGTAIDDDLFVNLATNATVDRWHRWHNASSDAQLNVIEVDNTIASRAECSGKRLKIVEFNLAQGGKRWLESAALLKGADAIILNGMDVGMARTDQQHTTRLLAYHLGMNYAWGLEFVDLTTRRGLASEERNFRGLRGNAILTKCEISDAVVFRDEAGQYLSKATNGAADASGTKERQLGGPMVLLGRIAVAGVSVVIGSVQKLNGSRRQIGEYVGSSPAIIGGDQSPFFCEQVGLNLVTSNLIIRTQPATCEDFKWGKGDNNICSNLKPVEDATYAQEPCVWRFGLNVKLSDHALIWSELELP